MMEYSIEDGLVYIRNNVFRKKDIYGLSVEVSDKFHAFRLDEYLFEPSTKYSQFDFYCKNQEDFPGKELSELNAKYVYPDSRSENSEYDRERNLKIDKEFRSKKRMVRIKCEIYIKTEYNTYSFIEEEDVETEVDGASQKAYDTSKVKLMKYSKIFLLSNKKI